MTFTTRWPDGETLSSYSPSLVVHDHLSVGTAYPVADFVARSTQALTTASERVEARYGFPCTAAQASLAQIRAVAARHPEGQVEVETMDPGVAS